MSNRSATATPAAAATAYADLPVHHAVMQAAGPEALTALARPLTAAENALVDEVLAEVLPLDDHALAQRLGIPAGLASEFRRLMAV